LGDCYLKKLSPYTLAGFDLTTHSSSLIGGKQRRYLYTTQLGDCLFWQVFKIPNVAQIFGLLFPTVKVMYNIILTENGLGNILGYFVTSSTGHPVSHPYSIP
jgi:hypothetical protein